MPSDQLRLTTSERANLVAYLDGELPETESRLLAAKLTGSISARREVEALEKAWELLDHLARPQASREFTERTLSQARAGASLDDRLVNAAARTARGISRAAVVVLSVSAAVGISYAATRWLWPDPSARLVRDLPIAEHLDEYREVGTFEFLKRLDDDPAFNEDVLK
jgi:anti-sigma factor RsiW